MTACDPRVTHVGPLKPSGVCIGEAAVASKRDTKRGKALPCSRELDSRGSSESCSHSFFRASERGIFEISSYHAVVQRSLFGLHSWNEYALCVLDGAERLEICVDFGSRLIVPRRVPALALDRVSSPVGHIHFLILMALLGVSTASISHKDTF